MVSTQNNYKPIEEIILEDHKEIRMAWQKYTDSVNKEDKMKWYSQFIYLVAKHFIAKEIVFLPLLRDKLVNGDVMADTDLAQTRRIKQLLYDLKDCKIDKPEFDTKLKACWTELE
jgi:hypothetical protein